MFLVRVLLKGVIIDTRQDSKRYRESAIADVRCVHVQCVHTVLLCAVEINLLLLDTVFLPPPPPPHSSDRIGIERICQKNCFSLVYALGLGSIGLMTQAGCAGGNVPAGIYYAGGSLSA